MDPHTAFSMLFTLLLIFYDVHKSRVAYNWLLEWPLSLKLKGKVSERNVDEGFLLIYKRRTFSLFRWSKHSYTVGFM